MMQKSFYSALFILFFTFSITVPIEAAQTKKKSKRSTSSKALKSNKTSKSSKSSKSSRSSRSSKTIHPASKANYPISGQWVSAMQGFDHSFVQFLRKWRMPGASVAIMKHGKLVFARGYGYADERHKHPIQPFSLFRIASVSKAVTAIAIMKLVQDGYLSLDTPVFRLLDDIKPVLDRNINPRIYQVTVRDLLQISSGWASRGQGGFDPMFGPWPARFSKNVPGGTPASCLNTTRMMMTWPMHYRPGSSQSYINLDYCLLGLVINKVTRTPYGHEGYQNYVVNHILRPLGIYDMRIGSTRWSEKSWNEVRYYRYPRNANSSTYLPYSNEDILKKNFSNGGWVASSPDIARLIYALAQGHILRAPYLQEMLTHPSFKSGEGTYFAMGLKVFKRPEGRHYWVMTGSFTGTNAYVLRKANDTVVAVLFNSRPDAGSLFGRFRPELKRLLLSSKIPF